MAKTRKSRTLKKLESIACNINKNSVPLPEVVENLYGFFDKQIKTLSPLEEFFSNERSLLLLQKLRHGLLSLVRRRSGRVCIKNLNTDLITSKAVLLLTVLFSFQPETDRKESQKHSDNKEKYNRWPFSETETAKIACWIAGNRYVCKEFLLNSLAGIDNPGIDLSHLDTDKFLDSLCKLSLKPDKIHTMSLPEFIMIYCLFLRKLGRSDGLSRLINYLKIKAISADSEEERKKLLNKASEILEAPEFVESYLNNPAEAISKAVEKLCSRVCDGHTYFPLGTPVLKRILEKITEKIKITQPAKLKLCFFTSDPLEQAAEEIADFLGKVHADPAEKISYEITSEESRKVWKSRGDRVELYVPVIRMVKLSSAYLALLLLCPFFHKIRTKMETSQNLSILSFLDEALSFVPDDMLLNEFSFLFTVDPGISKQPFISIQGCIPALKVGNLLYNDALLRLYDFNIQNKIHGETLLIQIMSLIKEEGKVLKDVERTLEIFNRTLKNTHTLSPEARIKQTQEFFNILQKEKVNLASILMVLRNIYLETKGEVARALFVKSIRESTDKALFKVVMCYLSDIESSDPDIIALSILLRIFAWTYQKEFCDQLEIIPEVKGFVIPLKSSVESVVFFFLLSFLKDKNRVKEHLLRTANDFKQPTISPTLFLPYEDAVIIAKNMMEFAKSAKHKA